MRLEIGVQKFSKLSPNWKYAGNWKGHACLSREGFLRNNRGMFETERNSAVHRLRGWPAQLSVQRKLIKVLCRT